MTVGESPRFAKLSTVANEEDHASGPSRVPPAATRRARRGILLVLLVVAASLIVAGVLPALRSVRGPRSSAQRPNVLLVTIDTLRADHLGCYGGKAATPVLDALAARGVRFPTAVAHVPLTCPSHASILTGRTPLGHGIRDNGGFVLPTSVPTVAEAFRTAGYRTAAFVSGFPLSSRFGLDRGFETYDDHLARGNDPRRPAYVERFADRTTDAALACTTTIPTPPTRRPPSLQRALPRPTTARLRSWTRRSHGCSTAFRTDRFRLSSS
jgi:hypothetical protein